MYMKLRVSCDLKFQIRAETALILMLRPYRGAQQRVIHPKYIVDPDTTVIESKDQYGNSRQRLLALPGEFKIHTSAEVVTTSEAHRSIEADFVEIQYLPDTVLQFLLPSRYCESDRFGDLARALIIDARPGYDQVSKISEWIHLNINYIPGSSDIPLSALETYCRGYGVCRDLAQLGIAFCRSVSIPARLVVGYLYQLEPMDLHAWFEAYVGGRWYAFDPTQAELSGGRVIIAYGRDAADVSIYHQFGSGCLLDNMDVCVNLRTQSKPIEH